MTKQIERAYRSNRRRSWLLIAAVVALAAAIAIPIASGAAEKTYTLGFDTTSPPTPAQTKTVCAAAATRVYVFLTNTARSVSLGSAKVTIPSGATVESASKSVGGSVSTFSPSGLGTREVLLQSLGLGRGDYVKLVVKVPSSGSSGGPISAIVKQSSNFNDAESNTSNLFSNPGGEPAIWSTLYWAPCGSISGTIWNDQNENGSKETFEQAQFGSDLPSGAQAWTVKLYKKDEQSGSYSEFTGATLAPPLADGAYKFSNVPLGSQYAVCETAPGGTWTQTTGAVIATPSPCTTLPQGWTAELSSLIPNVTGKDFGNANTVVIDCTETGPNANKRTIGTSETPTRYTVKVAGSSGNLCDKDGAFVLEAYAPTLTQRVANFHPAGGVTTTIDLYVIEQLEWNFDGTAQPGVVPDNSNPLPLVGADGRTLKYDDDPYNAPGLESMPYCLKDPRANATTGVVADPWSLVSTTDVLPPSATSCLMASTEKAVGAEPFRREDWIFSSVDGLRLGP